MELKIESFHPSELNPAPYNPRRISERAFDGLVNSISTLGYLEPIVVNVKDGKNRVVSGHQRLSALIDMGVGEIPAVVVQLDEAAKKAANLAMNNRHIQGEWDPKQIEDLLENVQALDPSLFGEVRLGGIAKDLEIDLGDPFEPYPEPQESQGAGEYLLKASVTHPLKRGEEFLRELQALCLRFPEADLKYR